MDRESKSSFVLDVEKELGNSHKHEVNFATAAKSFKDHKRKIYIDSKHSKKEEMFFCKGER